MHEARYHLTLSCGCPDAGLLYLWPRRMGPSAPAPLPASYEVMSVKRWRGDGHAAHASSWVGKHGGEAVSEPLIVWA